MFERIGKYVRKALTKIETGPGREAGPVRENAPPPPPEDSALVWMNDTNAVGGR